jgi:hypothetical protein
MSWKMSRFASSLMGLLREPEPETGTLAQVECIRTEMQACMAAVLPDPAARPPVWGKVALAPDMQTLWYLRSDLMHLLCDHRGEAAATRQMAALTGMFRGHLPAAQFASANRNR